MKKILLLCFLLVQIVVQAQTTKDTPPAEDTSLYSWTDESPEFPGGEGAMRTYIMQHCKYPEYEKNKDIEGIVWVGLIVEKDGSISKISIIRGVTGGDGLSKEAIRVISDMPKFKPGKMNGKTVRCTWQIPFKFSLPGSTNTDSTKTIQHGGH